MASVLASHSDFSPNPEPKQKDKQHMKNKLKNILAASLIASASLFITSCASTGGASTASVGGTKSYPLKTCIVTGNDLGSMGDEQRIVYQGQEIKFCCAPCVEKFQKNPAKYLAKLN
jgi:hypothetical protein